MNNRILFVDDEKNILDGLRHQLYQQRKQWDMRFASSVDEALTLMASTPVDAVVTDVMMPGRDGFDLLKTLRQAEETKDIPVVILTGIADTNLKRKALDMGVTDLLAKPVMHEDLVARLRNMLNLKAQQDQLKSLNRSLEGKVRARTRELEHSRLDILWRLGKAAEYRDEQTGYHLIRVASYCKAIARKLRLDAEFTRMLFLSSPLHDVGKIGVPDGILLKPGKLTSEERAVIERHCEIGAKILEE